MTSRAGSVPEYLAELPEPRRFAIGVVRETILANLPVGYAETMLYGMIAYRVPEATFTLKGGKPLGVAALASQKQYMARYLSEGYWDPAGAEAFREAYRATGKRLDMGEGCVRFRKLDDLPLELVARTIASLPVERLVQMASRPGFC